MNFLNYVNENAFNRKIGIEKEVADPNTQPIETHTSSYGSPNDPFGYNFNSSSFSSGGGGGNNNNGQTNQYYNRGRLRKGVYPLFNNTYSNNCGGSMRRYVVCNRRSNGVFNNSQSRQAYLKQKRLREVQEEKNRKLNRSAQYQSVQPIQQQINNGSFGYSFSNYREPQQQYQQQSYYQSSYQQPQQQQYANTQPIQRRQTLSQASSDAFPSYSRKNSYNIGNIIDTELKTGQRINLVSALDRELERKMENSSVSRSLDSNLDVVKEEDLTGGDKRVILSIEDDNYFLSKYTYRKYNHLLTKDSFFYFGFNNINVTQNKDYYLNVDIEQKFKYANYPLELMVYGMNKMNLLNYFLKVPLDTTVLKFNTKLFDSVTLLLYSKKRLYNSVIKVNNLELFDYITNNKSKDVNKLTDDIFENINNDDNFNKIYDELDDLFSDRNSVSLDKKISNSLLDCYRRLKGKSSLDRYKENTIEEVAKPVISTAKQYEIRSRSLDLTDYYKQKEEENKVEIVEIDNNINNEEGKTNEESSKKSEGTGEESEEKRLIELESPNSEINDTKKREIILSLDDEIGSVNSDNRSVRSFRSNVSRKAKELVKEKNTVEESKNILGDLKRKENRAKNSLFGQMKSQNKKALANKSVNDFSVLSKKLIHEFDFKIENFKKNGTLTLNNNITKNLEIHNLTDHHGYVKFDLEVKKLGNYYIDYTLRDSAFANVNILATTNKYTNLVYASTSPELKPIRNFDYFRKQVFFHVTEVCGCAGNPDKKVVTIIFYFNVKQKMVASFDNIKIYYIIKPDELQLNKDENSIIHESVDTITEEDDPLENITNHQRSVNLNVLYEYNFLDLDKKDDIFTFKEVNIGSFHNEENGIIVRPNRDNQVGQIVIKKPILTRHFKVLVELDAFVIGGMNANFIGFDGKEQKFNIPITQTNDTYNKIKFIIDQTTGVLFFGIFFNYLNKEAFNGLVLNNLRICGVDSTYTIRGMDSNTFEYTEERLDGMISDLEGKIEGKLGTCL